MTAITQSRVDANWRAITVELDAPLPGAIERALRRLGLPSEVTRVVAATPALRRSWFVALFIVVVVGLGAAGNGADRNGLFTLLLLAPLVPVLGVSFAYGPDADPGHEIALATPMRGLRLLSLRAFALHSVATIALLFATMLTPPGSRMVALGWILPSLGLTAICVAATTAMTPRRAAALVATGWAGFVTLTAMATSERLAAFGSTGQLVALLAMAAGSLLAYRRRSHLDQLDVQHLRQPRQRRGDAR